MKAEWILRIVVLVGLLAFAFSTPVFREVLEKSYG